VGLCGYGTFVISTLFWGEVEDKELLTAVYYDSVKGVAVEVSYWVVGMFMFRRRFEMAFVLVLISFMGLALGLFLMFHLWIAARGMTTNEFYKWRQVSKWHKFEKRRFEKAKLDGTLKVVRGEGEGGDTNNTTTTTEGTKGGGMVPLTDGDVGCTGPVTATTTKNTNEDEQMSRIADPGPYPKNIYNLGILENYKEILFPRSLRKDAIDRWARNSATQRTKGMDATTRKQTKDLDVSVPSSTSLLSEGRGKAKGV